MVNFYVQTWIIVRTWCIFRIYGSVGFLLRRGSSSSHFSDMILRESNRETGRSASLPTSSSLLLSTFSISLSLLSIFSVSISLVSVFPTLSASGGWLLSSTLSVTRVSLLLSVLFSGSQSNPSGASTIVVAADSLSVARSLLLCWVESLIRF